MCLHQQLGVPEKTEGIGWKVFKRDSKTKRLHSGCYNTARAYSRRKWHAAVKDSWNGYSGRLSEDGFHIFTRREDAALYLGYLHSVAADDRPLARFSNAVLRKVRFRGAFLHGIGDGEQAKGGWHLTVPVVVANEIYIIEANRA